MTTRHEIVVAVDGSAPSRAALGWAVREASATGRRVCAVRVFDSSRLVTPTIPVVEAMEATRDAELEALRETVTETVGEAHGIPLELQLLEGDPAGELVGRAEDAALLVLGSHGRGRARSTVLGSVGAACVRRVSCPVLIIPPHAVDLVLPAGDARSEQAI